MQNIIHTKNSERGFTLIELLVVIAIIGILSSIVLVSLLTAQKKGTDGAVKGDLGTLRTQAALDYAGNGNSYGSMGTTVYPLTSTPLAWTGTPGDTNIPLFVGATIGAADRTAARALNNTYNNANGNDVQIYANGNIFSAAAKLNYGGPYWCVDSNGYGGKASAMPNSASNFVCKP